MILEVIWAPKIRQKIEKRDRFFSEKEEAKKSAAEEEVIEPPVTEIIDTEPSAEDKEK